MALEPKAAVDRPGRAALRVGVLGAGTVGGAVVRALLDRAQRRDDTPALALAGVAVRDTDAAERRGLPRPLLTDAPAHLVADPEIDVIVELLGGEQPARTLVAAALAGGRSVVTANKLLIARHGAELEALARRTGAALRFEAAVGGGTPILGPLASELAANRIGSIRGIVNGTTNFILTEMAATGRAYEEVLAEAQAAGYAEADPTADVEGRDAIDKLVILARLGFGTWLEPAHVLNRLPLASGATGQPGIVGITSADVAAARRRGLAIRLIATAQRTPDGSVDASVIPTAVSIESAFGRTMGVLNRIEIEADLIGIVAFEGPGAGGTATSSAVVADLLAIARGQGSTWAGLPPARAEPPVGRELARPASTDWFEGPSGGRYPILE